MEDDDSGADTLKAHALGDPKNVENLSKPDSSTCTTEASSPAESSVPHSLIDADTSKKHLVSSADDGVVKEKKVNGDCEGNNDSVDFKASFDDLPSNESSDKCSTETVSKAVFENCKTEEVSGTVTDITSGEPFDKCKNDIISTAASENCIGKRTDNISNNYKLDIVSDATSELCNDNLNLDCSSNKCKTDLISETVQENSVCNLNSDVTVDKSNFGTSCDTNLSETNNDYDETNVDNKPSDDIKYKKLEILNSDSALETIKPSERISNEQEIIPHSPRISHESDLEPAIKEESIQNNTDPCVTALEQHDENNSENSECLNKNKNNKRKIDNDNEDNNTGDAEIFPIQYKGFKKKLRGESEQVKIDKRISLKGNPFNPAWKKDPKPSKSVNITAKQNQSVDKGIDVDSSTLQPEYAQYLGLQPIVKFKCSNCGASSFQTMSALNAHQIECKKFGKVQSPPNMTPQLCEAKSTNIKLTRKVFLCSACGTYYENWNLFLHMREVHRRYICLYCLGMFSVAEKLAEHLMQKHKVTMQNFAAVDEFQKSCHPNYYLLCLSCDNVFSETDNFYSHVCSDHNTNNNDSSSINKGVADNTTVNSNVAPPKPPSPEFKSRNNSNKLVTQAKKGHADWTKRMPNQKGSPNRKDYDEDYICNAASFCHVDIDDSQMNNSANTVKKLEVDKTKDKGQEKSAEESKIPENKDGAEAENSNVLPDVGSSTQVNVKPENSDEVLQPMNSSSKEKVNSTLIEKRPIKKPRSVTIKRPVKKKKISQVSKPQKLFVKLKNSIPTVEMEREQKPVEKELETQKMINDSSIKENETPSNVEKPDNRQTLEKGMLKIKLQSDIESDGESDDSQKLSMVVDENNSVSDYDSRKTEEEGMSHQTNSSVDDEQGKSSSSVNNMLKDESCKEGLHDEIQLAGEDVAAMALTLDDKINNVKIQSVVKECVRTSCLSCNYCRHAVKIAVNGKQLALHLLSEHRYMPVKNETSDDVVRKLKSCLEDLKTIYFNTETYDSSDASIHIPYDKDDNFDCFQCNYVTNSHRDLYAHKRKSHTKSLLLCIMCKTNFYSYSELLCHLCPGSYNAEIQFQNADINFRCCFCRLDTIPSAFRLMVHLRKCHHTCDICLEICSDQQKLSTHMWKHKLNHLCYRCGIAYASKPDITKHLFWKHGTESVLCKKCMQKKWPHVYHFCIPPTSFICEECNTSFSKAVALKVHKRIHAGDLSYACSQCDKRFISKKLLSRHEDRHNGIIENKENAVNKNNEISDTNHKEEIINVTDVPNESKETSGDLMDTSKDSDIKDKCHKKHKKDKEKDKKSKQVVDVYDIPPLNLSSDSDSSDENEQQKKNNISNDIKDMGMQNDGIEKKDSDLQSGISTNDSISHSLVKEKEEVSENMIAVPSTGNKISGEDNISCNPDGLNNLVGSQKNEHPQESDNLDSKTKEIDTAATDVVDSSIDTELNPNNQTTDNNPNTSDNVNNDAVEGIWENFYKNNSQNKNLPYPLCAMKSEVAYGIIMGDHDYCQQYRNEPVINEDIPTSNIDLNLSDDKIENEDPVKPSTPVHLQDAPTTLINNLSKKKQKSPKKKTSKGNSSSSSDSSTDSDSTSCSCGTNCSCSSTSSNSSSSTSSDSDSSSTEGRMKQERRRKRKERRVKPKEETATEAPKEPVETEPEVAVPVEPEDPPIRESELETDETSTDEEFYDCQPQRIANQLLAEKRNQLMLLASVAPVNNGTSSPTPSQESTATEPPPVPTNSIKQRQRTRRREGKKKVITKEKQIIANEKILSSPIQYPETPVTNPKQYKPLESKILSSAPHTPIPDVAPGSGSETESMRSSKRRRIPNKFYGYSSGEEEDSKPTPMKWRKQDLPAQSPKRQILPPPTPRIQLTVPKQVIRKHNAPKPKSDSSSNESDSSDDSVQSHQNQSQQQQETKADVYCYCRCPYDEVSEMIACDDENCKIEWFHFECVGILVPPRGQWYCPECRKRRGLPT